MTPERKNTILPTQYKHGLTKYILYRNSWCDPFKSWQKVCINHLKMSINKFINGVITYRRTHSILLRVFRRLKCLWFLVVRCRSFFRTKTIPTKHTIFSRPTAFMGRTIFSSKSGQHRVASSSGFSRGSFSLHTLNRIILKFLRMQIFWTGANLPDGTAINVRNALPRLHDLRFRMVQRGINAIALQPQWCALRDGSCNIDS